VTQVSKELVHLAKPFKQIQQQVASLLENCILIGHALSNDLDVLVFGCLLRLVPMYFSILGTFAHPSTAFDQRHSIFGGKTQNRKGPVTSSSKSCSTRNWY
jgi:hypothetical protein